MHLTAVLRSLTVAAAVAACSGAAAAGSLPSYATSEETIKGTIASVSGNRHISIRDERGFIDDVTLHDGTVINPTGLKLSPGQTVTVLGRNAGSTFTANEIDTPYSERSGVTYAYPYLVDGAYGAPYAYGYPAYPYAYGYGVPFASVGFSFGGGYYGHGGYYGRGYYGHGGYGGRGYYGHPGYGGVSGHVFIGGSHARAAGGSSRR